MFPVELFINQPAAPLGACMELSPQRGTPSFNRSALLNARLRSSAPRMDRPLAARRSWARQRAGPISSQRSPAAPLRIVRRLVRR